MYQNTSIACSNSGAVLHLGLQKNMTLPIKGLYNSQAYLSLMLLEREG